jgi:hypothetical protein
MKSSNEGLIFSGTKYSRVFIRLLGIGGVFGILSWVVRGNAKNWFSGIGLFALAAALVILLVSTIADRKQLESKRKKDAK